MLAQVNGHLKRTERGFTMIELMVTIAIAGVLLALAAPSFLTTLARKNFEGVGAELHTDLQYARSEAVQRNAAVRVFVGSNCYAILIAGASAPTSCTSLGTLVPPLKLVTAPVSTISFTFVPRGSNTYLEFDPVRGMALDSSGTDASGDVSVATTAANWQIQSRVTKVGRIKNCSPNNTITSLATDCSIT